MRNDYFAIALLALLAAGRSHADVLTVPEGEPTPQIVLPSKGVTMAEVEKHYGAPRQKRPTVGGDSPKHPPITRWDYDAFSVIFERDKVVDTVVPGAPPRIYNKDELKPAVVYMPTPEPTPAPAEPEVMPAEPVPPLPESVPAEAPAPPAETSQEPAAAGATDTQDAAPPEAMAPPAPN